ncbi:Uma2 family endonuclease [Breznakiellaceae bacterium SP9]
MSNALRKSDFEDEDYDYCTYNEYASWQLKEGERFELIDGVVYEMAAPSAAHQLISGELFRQIANFLHRKPCKVFAVPYDVRLFYERDGTDDTVVQPDIVVVCDEKKRGKEGCRGTPDFVIEILSPSNSGEEMNRKFIVYMEAGVREYWVVSPEAKTITAFCLKDESYHASIYKLSSTPPLAPIGVLEGLSITLEDLFNQ